MQKKERKKNSRSLLSLPLNLNLKSEICVACRFPRIMRAVAVWTAFVLAYSSSPFVAGIRYIDPISPQSGNTGDIAEKRVDLTEPTCEELRAMWRNTKRQSRAAKTTTEYSFYPDPFSIKVWKSYSERSKPPLNYLGKIQSREMISCNLLLFQITCKGERKEEKKKYSKVFCETRKSKVE